MFLQILEIIGYFFWTSLVLYLSKSLVLNQNNSFPKEKFSIKKMGKLQKISDCIGLKLVIFKRIKKNFQF